MNLSFSEEDLKFQDEVRSFIAENYPADIKNKMDNGIPVSKEDIQTWQRILSKKGWFAVNWPEEYGGTGWSITQKHIFQNELADANTPTLVPFGVSMCGPVVYTFGTQEQKDRFLPGIINNDVWWCQGYSEPGSGSDLASLKTKAVKDGDEYVINGSKIWTSLGSYAKYMILIARTSNEDSSKYAGLSFFLAPMDAEGVEPRPIKKLTGEYGFCQTFFNDARIPATSLMGKEGEGWKVAMATLMFERGATGGQAGGLAMMDLSINDIVELARRTKRNGRPAIEDNHVRSQLVELITESKNNSLMSARSKISALATDWPAAVDMSGKLRSSELKRRMCQFALSLQGANGSRFIGSDAIDGGMWQRSYLNAFSGTIGGGTSQIQHNIIGERVLGLPK